MNKRTGLGMVATVSLLALLSSACRETNRSSNAAASTRATSILAGEDACNCSGTGPGGAVVVAACGQSACGSDDVVYACSASGWQWTGAACAGDAGATCECHGTGPGGVAVVAACGQSACGSDDVVYACSASGWQWTGAACSGAGDAGSTCECHGTGPGGVAVVAACGQSACGSDHVVYACSASGWQWTGEPCAADAGPDHADAVPEDTGSDHASDAGPEDGGPDVAGIDECLTNHGGCDPLSECLDLPVGRACGPCPAGYTGTGESGCHDIDECAGLPCQHGGDCTNTPGSFTCHCREGWIGSACEVSVPVQLLAASDLGDCSSAQTIADLQATSALAAQYPGTIAVLGDTDQGATSTYQDYLDCFDRYWGMHKPRIRPVPGNHDYFGSDGIAGYFSYYGAVAGTPAQSYYSYDLGAWHVIALDDNCDTVPGGCAAGSAEERWLRQDLAAHPSFCTLAYFHQARYSSGQHGNITAAAPLWQALLDHGVDLALSGHDHDYERWVAQDNTGNAAANGIVQFVVGTGGTSLRAFSGAQPANSVIRSASAHGVLRLTLREDGYDWQFLPIPGNSLSDQGSANCHVVCPPGYQAVGPACVNIDECLTDNGGCDPLTTCTDTDGGRTCGACPSGFIGTGETGCRAEGAWLSPAWRYRKRISVDHRKVSAALAGFPLLVSTTDADLAAYAQPGGNDLVFTGGDGVTGLAWEIESFSHATGALVAWVRVPNLSSTGDTDVYLYYGNAAATNQQSPAAVWDGNYAAVWHLNDDPSAGTGAIKDSTGNANHGTAGGTMLATALVGGKAGGAISFDGSDDLLNMGNPNSLNNLNPLTLEGWLCLTGAGETNPRVVSKQGSSGESPLNLSIPTSTGYCASGTNCLYYTRARSTQTLSAKTGANLVPTDAGCAWSHVVLAMNTASSPAAQIWLNGVLQSVTLTAGTGTLTSDASYAFILGNNSAGTRSFKGRLDEWRVSNTVRNANWIKTSYANQSSPTTFYGVSTQQTAP